MKFEITLKDVPTKKLIANFILDDSNTIDVVIETLMKKSTIKRRFVIIKNYFVYLCKENYVIESLYELSIWQAFQVMWEKIKSRIDNKVEDLKALENYLD